MPKFGVYKCDDGVKGPKKVGNKVVKKVVSKVCFVHGIVVFFNRFATDLLKKNYRPLGGL